MSHVVPINKVNQFLPQDKLELDDTVVAGENLPADHDKFNDLEETARDIVFGRLGVYYDTSTWADPASTPSMVMNILGMLVAGWVYDRQFSEEATEGGSYGSRRVAEAYRLLEGVIAGEYSIGVDLLVDATAGAPSYLASDPTFEMGEAF